MINNLLKKSAEDFSDRVAVEHKDRSLSYNDLYTEACSVANGLEGLIVGGSVGIMLPNIPEFISIAYGLFMGGYVATPFSVLLTPKEVKHIIEDSGLSLIFVHKSFISVVETAIERAECKPKIVVVGGTSPTHHEFSSILCREKKSNTTRDPDSHYLTMYTSGTTGAAKGVMMSGKALLAQSTMLKNAFNIKREDRILCTLPLFHGYGFNALVGTSLLSGATVVLHDHFNVSECVSSLENDNISIFAGVSTMYARILDFCSNSEDKYTFSDLDICLTGGAPMDSLLLAEFENTFSTQIHEGYGLTETTVSVCSNTKGQNNRKIGSVGRPYTGILAKVVDSSGEDVNNGEVGELVFKGENVMIGYKNFPIETQAVLKDGWLFSGDLGYIDEEGFCFIVGRQKDLIIKSGYNIFPKDVEEAIRDIDIVKDVAVFGVPDRIKGETIVASVILKPRYCSAEAKGHIVSALKATLAKYKHPNDFIFLKAFPVGHTGKITKNTIRDTYLNQIKMERI